MTFCQLCKSVIATIVLCVLFFLVSSLLLILLPNKAGQAVQRMLAQESSANRHDPGTKWLDVKLCTCFASSCLTLLVLLVCNFLGSCLHIPLKQQQLKAC